MKAVGATIMVELGTKDFDAVEHVATHSVEKGEEIPRGGVGTKQTDDKLLAFGTEKRPRQQTVAKVALVEEMKGVLGLEEGVDQNNTIGLVLEALEVDRLTGKQVVKVESGERRCFLLLGVGRVDGVIVEEFAASPLKAREQTCMVGKGVCDEFCIGVMEDDEALDVVHRQLHSFAKVRGDIGDILEEVVEDGHALGDQRAVELVDNDADLLYALEQNEQMPQVVGAFGHEKVRERLEQSLFVHKNERLIQGL